jgi:hypothetical protein
MAGPQQADQESCANQGKDSDTDSITRCSSLEHLAVKEVV